MADAIRTAHRINNPAVVRTPLVRKSYQQHCNTVQLQAR